MSYICECCGERHEQLPLNIGIVSGAPRVYRDLEGHGVRIRFGPAGERPTFMLKRSTHPLYREQRAGITLHRVQEILHIMYPDEY